MFFSSNFESIDGIEGYDIWAAACTEIEVDLLTGEKMVKRVDLIEDTGSSISPNVDVGQIEGAFVMGIGLWLSEELKYDTETGRLLTRDTWVIGNKVILNASMILKFFFFCRSTSPQRARTSRKSSTRTSTTAETIRTEFWERSARASRQCCSPSAFSAL